MPSIQRRFNSTGRVRITRDRIDVELQQPQDLSIVPTARASLRLQGLNIPGDARVAIEAYYRTSSMRFPCGTVNELTVPESMMLSDIDIGGAVRFRVLVIAADGSGRILAAADELRASTRGNGADRQALLPMRETDLGSELWKIDVEHRTGPVLLVNNRVSGLAAKIRTDPLLQGLILPHAFRNVLQDLSASGDDDEDDFWGEGWRKFLAELEVETEAEDPSDPKSVEVWIEMAVKAFCDLKRFAEQVKLVGHQEPADG